MEIGDDALARLGWNDRVAALTAGMTAEMTAEMTADLGAPEDAVPGRVVRVERGACTVATDHGEHLVRHPTPPAVGDWVLVRTDPTRTTLVGVAPRWSALTRRDPSGLVQVLAANVDRVLIAAPADRVSPARVERETVMAWDSGAVPVVLLTKHDLAPPGMAADLEARLVGVDVIPTSTVTGEGIDEVTAVLRPHRTGVLLGPSGAGKSSLANVLLGDASLAVGRVRAADRRGRHTTTRRELVAVPGGGVLVDTPGLRSLGLAADDTSVAAAFPEVEALALECRFGDCRHEQEPGCAVLAGIEAGTLDAARAASYTKLRRELDYEARRDDPLAAREAARVWKSRAKAVRRFYRERGA